MRTYVIGRSRYADVVLSGQSVAPRHAEVTVTADGRAYLIHAGAASGTWLQRSGSERWEQVRQDFIGPDDTLRFGDQAVKATALLDALRGSTRAGAATIGAFAEAGGSGAPAPRDDRPRGRVERDPTTGEIVRKAT